MVLRWSRRRGSHRVGHNIGAVIILQPHVVDGVVVGGQRVHRGRTGRGRRRRLLVSLRRVRIGRPGSPVSRKGGARRRRERGQSCKYEPFASCLLHIVKLTTNQSAEGVDGCARESRNWCPRPTRTDRSRESRRSSATPPASSTGPRSNSQPCASLPMAAVTMERCNAKDMTLRVMKRKGDGDEFRPITA